MSSTYATTSRHKPCRFNPDGATKEYCTSISAIPTRQQQGCNACASKWKAKPAAKTSRDTHNTSDRLAQIDAQRASRPLRVVPPMRVPVVLKEPAPVDRPPAVKLVTAKPPVSRPPAVVSRKIVETQPEEPVDDGSWREVLKRIQIAIANGILVKLPPSRLRPMPGQPREFFDEGGLARLEASIREVGQIQLGLCRAVVPNESGSDHELLDGERRWRVASKLGLPEYRALKVEIDDEAAPYIVAAISNFNRAEHTPIEIAKSVHKLHNGLRMPMAAVADMIGFSRNYAYAMQRLLNLRQEVQDMLDPLIMGKNDCMPTVAAMKISRAHVDLQLGLAHRVMNGEITMRQLDAEITKLGDEAGLPVRTRAVNSTHRFDSFVSMGRNLSAIASDLRQFVGKDDFASFICTRDPKRVHQVQVALTSVEDMVLICKMRIAEALKQKRSDDR